MAEIQITITATATPAQIQMVIGGLEMQYGRLEGGETDLQYVKRIFADLLKEAYKRKREAELTQATIAANPTEGEIVIT